MIARPREVARPWSRGLARRARALPLALAAGFALVTSGCGDSAVDRFEAARVAAQDAPDLDDYLLYFTKASAAVLRGSEAVRKRDPSLGYVPDARKVLPQGDVTKVDERGGLIVLTVGAGSKAQQVRMVQEDDAWVIDGLSLRALIEPLRGGAP